MSFNPFKEKPEKIDKLFIDFSQMYPKSYKQGDVDPYTKVRCILLNGAEYEAVFFSHNFSRHCTDNDVRRRLALVRGTEQQQQKKIACLKPIGESVLETTISYEQLAVDLTANLAAREKDPYIKHAMDFALLEDFDHLYRFADLLNFESGVPAEKLVGGYTEIMPGRPTISEHRHPFDKVCRPQKSSADLSSKLGVCILTAAEQQTMNYYMNQSAFYLSDLGRELYSEIALIEEDHVTRYGSLADSSADWYKQWLMHEYTECYLYYSAYMDETDPYIKKIWQDHLVIEIAHLHFAKDTLREKGGVEWQQVIPGGEFPELLSFKPRKEYIRNVLQNTVRETAFWEDYTDISSLKDGADFFTYQGMLCGDGSKVPSHIVIDRHIDKFGTDYRSEIAANPIRELQDRTVDEISLARTKVKVNSVF